MDKRRVSERERKTATCLRKIIQKELKGEQDRLRFEKKGQSIAL